MLRTRLPRLTLTLLVILPAVAAHAAGRPLQSSAPDPFLPARRSLVVDGSTDLLALSELYAECTAQELALDPAITARLAATSVSGRFGAPAEDVQYFFESVLVEAGFGLRALAYGPYRVLVIEALEQVPLESARYVPVEDLASLGSHPAELVSTAIVARDFATWRRARAEAAEVATHGSVRMLLPRETSDETNGIVLWGPSDEVVVRARHVAGIAADGDVTPARHSALTELDIVPPSEDVSRPVAERLAPLPPLDDAARESLVVRREKIFRLTFPDGRDALRLTEFLRAYELATWVDIAYDGGAQERARRTNLSFPTQVLDEQELGYRVRSWLASLGFAARLVGPGRSTLRVSSLGAWRTRSSSPPRAPRPHESFVAEERLDEENDSPLAELSVILATELDSVDGLVRFFHPGIGDDVKMRSIGVQGSSTPGFMAHGTGSAVQSVAALARLLLDAAARGPALVVVPVRGDATRIAERALDRLWGEELTSAGREELLASPYLDGPLVVGDMDAGEVLGMLGPGEASVLLELVRELDAKR